MRLIKRSDSVTKEQNQLGISRRAFMKNTSLAAGGAAVGASLFTPGMIRKAQASDVDRSAKTEVKRTICSHCSVGWVYTLKYKTVFGLVKSRLLITHSMRAVTVQKAPHCANTDTVNVA
ncbi:putative formate dehydrogenase, alpha subunit [Vibrio cholerae]|nr:putative formate dehydrogenase, alpha subunit [Vibrio cholerae]